MNDTTFDINSEKENEYFKSHDELIWFNEKLVESNLVNDTLLPNNKAKTKLITSIKKDYNLVI